jgi:AcrR family transcriptional regulator
MSPASPKSKHARTSTSATDAHETRTPSQERGQRRVEAILDAAAAIVAEEGVAAATVHGVARRARTSIGSMYHFFPDLESVLSALGERHVRGLRALLEALLDAGAPAEWGELPLADAVDEYLRPLLAYLEAHPDMMHVLRRPRPGGESRRNPELHALMSQLAEHLVRARTPRATPDQRTLRAATVLALVDGVLTRVERESTPPARLMMRELRRAIVAYLASYEAARR